MFYLRKVLREVLFGGNIARIKKKYCGKYCLRKILREVLFEKILRELLFKENIARSIDREKYCL